ncbi:uncharacterized protein BDZ99DRAFT_460607 [Mytilinidion resinicola]|uniref:Methyltransferase domain-containing protein n=1 Tax=Mytilinidion resinicola TaxID=574789 RepID=A0A6A6YZB8_9PEZI|nr:uncharacterized protein BDZ99DRAFT_460607 [Mytilinidion resinicola]KAF2813354.1 hypothetical protein BDZ99DRAFT_460607 [Mytilinidion resinicola]
MGPSPPPFSSSEYWDTRFHSNPSAFDWLQPASILDPHITAALRDTSEATTPNILHIGCGTSLLSYHLRAHVDEPSQIHNVDFSKEAIDLGKRREAEIFQEPNGEGEGNHEGQKSAENVDSSGSTSVPDEVQNGISSSNGINEQNGTIGQNDTNGQNDTKTRKGSKGYNSTKSPNDTKPTPSNPSLARPTPSPTHMRWTTVDLLSLPSLLSACSPGSYTLIVEKSCSDAIACAEDIPVSPPYPLSIRPASVPSLSASSSSPPAQLPPPPPSPPSAPSSPCYYIHPLTLLAVHLAALATPHARWICLSYSSARFPFLPASTDAESAVPRELLEQGFPDPAALWRLERREAVETAGEGEAGKEVHRPRVVHWVYVLERSEVEVVRR